MKKINNILMSLPLAAEMPVVLLWDAEDDLCFVGRQM